MAAAKPPILSAKEIKAVQIVERLRRHHQLGTRANDKELSQEEIDQLNEYTLDKFKAFARDYLPEELDELCSQKRPNELPLHWGYIPYLLTIQSKTASKLGIDRSSPRTKAARQRFQRWTVERGWSVSDLRAAISKRFPPKGSGHGRHLSKPKNLALGLFSLTRELDVLKRRVEMLAQLARKQKRRNIASECATLAAALAANHKKLTAKLKRMNRARP